MLKIVYDKYKLLYSRMCAIYYEASAQ